MLIIDGSPRWSVASTGSSPNTWATACSCISATRRRMRTMPSGRCGRGLKLVAAMNALLSPVSLQVRVGIATGLVVVGDLIGSGEAQERGIVGETPNLAARLQGIAEPNMVVIAEGTRKLLGNLFELADLGPKDLKGIAGPVPAWAALAGGFGRKPLRGDARDRRYRLVGREEETRIAAAALVAEPRPAKAKWCCSPASPASANRGSRPRC